MTATFSTDLVGENIEIQTKPGGAFTWTTVGRGRVRAVTAHDGPLPHLWFWLQTDDQIILQVRFPPSSSARLIVHPHAEAQSA